MKPPANDAPTEPPASDPAEVSRETIRAWDRRAIETYGVPGIALMENAGAAAARAILERESARRVTIVCGPGNNGGDGFVVARHLDAARREVSVWLVGSREQVERSPDSWTNLRALERSGVKVHGGVSGPAIPQHLADADVLVDALFGTGLSRPVGPPYLEWIEALNASRPPTVALDLPSGLDADDGSILGLAVQAEETITFAAPKLGLRRGDGPRLAGRIRIVPIGLPRCVLEGR